MVWTDFKNAFDIVLQSWIVDSLEIYKVTDNVIKSIEKIMKNSRVKLTAGGKWLNEGKI